MKQLPETRKDEAFELQRARLSRWLQDWEMHRRLSVTADETGPVEALPGGEGPAAWPLEQPGDPDAPLEEGQVRLVCPTHPAVGCPLYAAVLRRDQDNALEVAPFGRFSDPALPGELLLRADTACLRVLCLWNARRVAENSVADSWFVDRLEPWELEDALAVLGLLEGGDPVGPETARRLGPPLTHPDDPRWEYLEAERERIDLWLRGLVAESGQGTLIPWVGEGDTQRERAWAAESRPVYGVPSRLEARKVPVFLDVGPGAGAARVRVAVTDPDREPSSALSGWRIRAVDGRLSTPFRGAHLEVPVDLVRSGFTLMAPDGDLSEVVPV